MFLNYLQEDVQAIDLKNPALTGEITTSWIN